MILKALVRQLLVIFFTGTIISCNDGKKNSSSNVDDTILQKTIYSPQNADENNEITVNSIDSIPSQIKYEGKVVDSKRWVDKSGEHYVFITESNQGEYLTNNWMSKINAYMYTRSDNNFALDWQVKDRISISSEINYVTKSLIVKDIDQDGEAEAWFFYSFNEDGADPMPLKMILYSKQKKLAIRGVIPRSFTDFDLYKKTIDAKSINQQIENYASSEWDRVAIHEMQRLIGDDVTQLQDFPIKNN